MKGKQTLLTLLLVIAAAGIGSYLYMQSRSQVEPNLIRVSGNVEVTHAEVSFKIPGQVAARLVDEGELVRAGQLVARLDSTDLVHEVALRRAELQAAQAALAELEAGSRQEEIAQAAAVVRQVRARLDELLAGSRLQDVAAARAVVQREKAELDHRRADYERAASLHKRDLIAAQEYDAARAAYEVALRRFREAEERLKLVVEGPRREEIEQARAALAEAQQRYALVEQGPRQETIDQARARLEQAKAALALAETRLGYATLVSPLSGVVLSQNIEAGEYVAAGTPVVTVGDLTRVWLRAYINETDLGRVKVGQRVRVTTDSYPGKVYEGRVSFLASEAEFTPKNVQTAQERVKLVYRIKVDIPNPHMELKPGMPADADILLQPIDTGPLVGQALGGR
ncbi:MAG TPA: efflux RND transporter periplasmic adaptor subunit [Alphaproteobacteria bacterium]|nr:efflux RND transporter periplasmic adaptor subunit [Alphaproteobacteria bacterium]